MAKERIPPASSRRRRRLVVLLATALAFVATPATAFALSTTNNTPFPASRLIAGASWTGTRQGPPENQFGDILSTSWGMTVISTC
jgi:hypothetical protein